MCEINMFTEYRDRKQVLKDDNSLTPHKNPSYLQPYRV